MRRNIVPGTSVFLASLVAAALLFSACGGHVDHDPGATGGTPSATPSDGHGVCCPPGPFACCMDFGGFSPSGTCGGMSACDNLPDFADPGWHKEKDSHGCDQWVAPWNTAHRVCTGIVPPAADAGRVD